MRRRLITCGLVLLGLLLAADWIGGDATAIPWGSIIGLPIIGAAVAYMAYLAILKVSGKAANAEHDKRVGARMPKIIGAGIIGITLAAAVPHYGSILVREAQAQTGERAGGMVSSFDATTAGAGSALPPAWVFIAVPVLIVAGFAFIVRGKDAETRTVRGVAVVLTGLVGFIVSALTGVLA